MKLLSVLVQVVAALWVLSLTGCGGEVTMQTNADGTGSGSGGGYGGGGGYGSGGGGAGGAGGGTTVPDPCQGPICEVFADGPWLIGWAGGLDHFSWFRFTPETESAGKLHLLPAKCASCTGLYDCEGEGAYKIGPVGSPIDSESSTFVLELPASCAAAGVPNTIDLLITKIGPAQGPYPMGAELWASVAILENQQWLEGFLYPPSQCDQAFTTCGSPF